MGGYYFFVNLEKYGKFWKNGRFSGRIWPDWGNTAWPDMAGLGSIGNGFILSLGGHTMFQTRDFPISHLPPHPSQ